MKNSIQPCVYIVTNWNRTVLYTGVTSNLPQRLDYHKASTNVYAFTTRYKCFYLIYFEYFDYIKPAIAREKEIKGWSRAKKENLIKTKNVEWTFLQHQYPHAPIQSPKGEESIQSAPLTERH